ncbi:MAG: hypothetical protein LBC58_02410 [Clostridiales Family XIII bacterium]|jgi:hypothetical protein|nr:hypothetical protein [Clostridiales Family XIII bacterium]
MENNSDKTCIITEWNALEGAKAGLARGDKRFIIDRRSEHNERGGDVSYNDKLTDLMALSFLADMETEARIESDAETVYIVSGIRKSYYDFLMEIDGRKEQGPEGDAGRLALPYEEGARFSVLSWEERSEGVSVAGADPELTDAVLTHSYPVHTGFSFTPGKDAVIAVRRGRLLVIVERNCCK